jgi:hypothetical protein
MGFNINYKDFSSYKNTSSSVFIIYLPNNIAITNNNI